VNLSQLAKKVKRVTKEFNKENPKHFISYFFKELSNDDSLKLNLKDGKYIGNFDTIYMLEIISFLQDEVLKSVENEKKPAMLSLLFDEIIGSAKREKIKLNKENVKWLLENFDTIQFAEDVEEKERSKIDWNNLYM
jgi:hypothetical protein